MAALRPSADVSVVDWETGGGSGSNLYAEIDETTVSSTDYIVTEGGTAKFELTNPAADIAAATMRVRFRKDGDDEANLTVRLLQGDDVVAEWEYLDIADTDTDIDVALTSPQFALITDPSDLRVEFEATVASGASEEAETTAWAAAVVGAGGSVSGGRKTLVNDLIIALKAAGVWTKLDRLFIYAAENQQSALRDMKAAAASSLQTVGASDVSFSADDGYTGTAGGAQHIDTAFNPGGGGSPNYVQDSAHISIWVLNNQTGTQAIGVDSGGVAGQNIYPNFSGNCYTRINDNPEAGGLGISDPRGHIIGNRSSGTARQTYHNGVSLGSIGSTASQAPKNGNIIVLSSEGASGESEDWQIAMMSAGGSLNSTEADAFYDALRIYMTAVGVP